MIKKKKEEESAASTSRDGMNEAEDDSLRAQPSVEPSKGRAQRPRKNK